MTNRTSPFKFLDSYQKEDLDIFFGREKETEKLYASLSGVKHLLVYGPSGAGKTSLIECGLRNQFSDADWLAITVRRGVDLNASVFGNILQMLREPFAIDPATKGPTAADFGFGEAVDMLFAEKYKPVYLLFDQFEELLIQGSEGEKQRFFTNLQRLIRYKVPCRVLLVMREEFIGHLSEFEPLCPSLFQHRFRLEKMGRTNVQAVIQQVLEAKKYAPYFNTEQPKELAKAILAKLPDTQSEIELAHVQVFLGELWDRATAENRAEKPTLRSGLVKETDNLERVLDSFLKNQLKELAAAHGEKVPLELLAAMISERHTKLQLSEPEAKSALAVNALQLLAPLPDLLRDLEQRRIVRTLKAGDLTQYEISHDVLARVVGQNLTEDMKLREKAREIYRVFGERQGLFSQDDLDYLRAFEGYLGYPAGLGGRILESEARIRVAQKEELDRNRKRLRILRGLLTAAVVGMAFALAAMFWALSAQKKSEKALSDLKIENEKRLAAEAAKGVNEFDKDLSVAYGQLSGGNSCLSDETFERLQTAVFELNSEEIKKKIQDLNQTIQKNKINCPLFKTQK